VFNASVPLSAAAFSPFLEAGVVALKAGFASPYRRVALLAAMPSGAV